MLDELNESKRYFLDKVAVVRRVDGFVYNSITLCCRKKVLTLAVGFGQFARPQ